MEDAQGPQFTRGGSSAGPCLSFGIGTRLIRFGRVDAFQPNVGVRYDDCVAIEICLSPRLAVSCGTAGPLSMRAAMLGRSDPICE
jgi:hypothetical protein